MENKEALLLVSLFPKSATEAIIRNETSIILGSLLQDTETAKITSASVPSGEPLIVKMLVRTERQINDEVDACKRIRTDLKSDIQIVPMNVILLKFLIVKYEP